MKKIGLIALVTILVLGVVGVGYALWTQSLAISGSVTAGSLSAIYEKITPSSGPDTGNATVVTTGEGTGTMSITINNAYPGYTTTVNFNIKNTGTIPISLTGTTLTNTLPTWLTGTVLTIPSSTILAGAEPSGSLVVVVPSGETGNMAAIYTINVPIVATQTP